MSRWRRDKRHAQQPNLPGLFAAPLIRSHRLTTPHEQALGLAHGRILAIALTFVAAFLVISGRLVYLTLLSDTPDAQVVHADSEGSVASRADITDRNGAVLATSLPTVSLCAEAKNILNPDEAAKQLLGVLPELDAKKLNDDLHGSKYCAVIRRHLTPKQAYEVNKLGIAGLEFRPDERRVYPAGNVAAHVVGYTDVDNNGLAGMEKGLDARLEENPSPVALSIDLRVQTIMNRELGKAMRTFHAAGAAGLVMDAETGEILAMVSLPDFDPHRPGEATDTEKFNRDTLGVYEMGSTFKIFTAALALNSGLAHLGDVFDATKPIEVGHQTIRDFHPEDRWLNVAEVITHSSNIGAAHMAERFGGTRQRAFLEQLGLTEKVKLELPEVGAPLVPKASEWGDPTTMTVAFGHGIAVSAVQLTSAVATIANDGETVHPTLLKRTDNAKDDDSNRVISPRTAALMRGIMRLVVTRGTGKDAEAAGYLMGGKTGTANKLLDGRYDPNARLSSFIGVLPINAPKYLIFAMLDDPKGNANTYGFATGGMVAAPVVGHVAAQIAPLLGLPPLAPEMEAAAERQALKPLGGLMVDGTPVSEGSHYASVATDSVR